MSTNHGKKSTASAGRRGSNAGRVPNAIRKKRRSKSLAAVKDGSRHYVPPIEKQFLFQGMIKQFAEWPSWQKRLLLCRFSERSSATLLSTLSTALEPIFHRDFAIKSNKGFHSSLLETYLNHTPLSTAPHSMRSTSPPALSSRRSSFSTAFTENENIALLPNRSEGSEYIENDDKYTSLTPLLPTTSLKLTSVAHSKQSSKLWRDYKRRSIVKLIDNELSQACLAKNLDKRGILHTHIMSRNSGSLSTGEFLRLPQVKNRKQLGDLVKLNNNSNNSITHVGQFKHEKWWLPPISKGQQYQRASGKTLLHSFKKIADEFIHKYSKWTNAEKGDFMLNVVDKCSPDEIKFFANCIYQRLEKFNDINNLSDDILLHTFTFLDVDELVNAAQVCQRWRYLTTVGYLWERKCYELARMHGQIDLIKNLEITIVELDWKQLYHELKQSISVLETVENRIRTSSLTSNSKLLSAHNSDVSMIHDTKSHHSEDCCETVVKDKYLSPIDPVHQDLEEMVDVECKDCKADVVHSHVSFTGIHEVEVMESVDSKDNLEDIYQSEQELLSDQQKAEEEEESKKEEKDVALDVRVKLVQAPNQMKEKCISSLDAEVERDTEYKLIQVNNIKTISRVRKLEGHGDAVLCLQFDSKRVMTGSLDRTVRLWDIRTGRYFRHLVGHQGGVRCLKFDEKYIVTGSWDTTVMVWDVINFSLICTIAEHSDCVSCLELSSDILVTGSFDSTVCIFKRHSWELLARLEGHKAPVSCMTMVSEDELLTGSYDKTILLWDLDSFCVLRKFDSLNHHCLCVKVCGTLVAAGAYDGTITFLNLLSGEIEGRIVAHDGPVNAICFVKTSFFSAGSDKVVREWDLSTCTCLRSLRGHTAPVLSLRASAKRVVSGSVDGTARIWDMTYKLQQVGGKFDELNSSIIQTQVLNEQQFKEMSLTAK